MFIRLGKYYVREDITMFYYIKVFKWYYVYKRKLVLSSEAMKELFPKIRRI